MKSRFTMSVLKISWAPPRATKMMRWKIEMQHKQSVDAWWVEMLYFDAWWYRVEFRDIAVFLALLSMKLASKRMHAPSRVITGGFLWYDTPYMMALAFLWIYLPLNHDHRAYAPRQQAFSKSIRHWESVSRAYDGESRQPPPIFRAAIATWIAIKWYEKWKFFHHTWLSNSPAERKISNLMHGLKVTAQYHEWYSGVTHTKMSILFLADEIDKKTYWNMIRICLDYIHYRIPASDESQVKRMIWEDFDKPVPYFRWNTAR